MNGNDIEKLFDSKVAVDEVNNRDLRWMLLFFRQETQSGLEAMQHSMGTQEASGKTIVGLVNANTLAVGKAQQAHDDCPLSDEKGRDSFVSGAVRSMVIDAVKTANGTKAVVGPLNRSEAISVLGWVIMALVVGLVYLATNGGVQVPLP